MKQGFDGHLVSDPAQISLLSSPVRQELVDTLAALGGETDVATLAEQLGRPADGLYYHLRTLVEGGLLREVPTKEGSERRFRLVGGGPLRLAYDLSPDGNATALSAFARGLLQIAGRDFEDALTRADTMVTGAERELWASRNKGWLSADDMAEVNALLERLSVLTSQPKATGRDHLASLAFVLAPINPRPKRRPKRQAETV
jgi:DNA-binding transcriptional ArsR family regulator